jgi:hypothetical protein
MLVAKSELINAGKLTRVKLSNTKHSGLTIALFIVLVIYLINFLPNFIGLFQETDSLTTYYWQNYSLPFAIGVLVAIIVHNCVYRTTNQNFSVYPQTNTSRFLADQTIQHFWILAGLMLSTLLSVLQYAVIALLAHGRPNMHFVYSFDPLFVLAGLVVVTLYSAIIAECLTLIATLLHKFRLFAVIFLVALAAFSLANSQTSLYALSKLFAYLIYEHSVGWFIIKGLMTWAALLLLTIVINKYTVYEHRSSQPAKSVVVGIAVAVACTLTLIIVGCVAFRMIPGAGTGIGIAQEMTAEKLAELPAPMPEQEQIEIDISGLAQGSAIDVVTSGNIRNIRDAGEIISISKRDNHIVFLGFEDGRRVEIPLEYLIFAYDTQLDHIHGDKLLLSYQHPFFVDRSEYISPLIHPQFTADLIGSTLYLHYTYDKNVKALYVPMWSCMWQFAYFQGNHLYNEAFAFSYSSNVGRLSVTIE